MRNFIIFFEEKEGTSPLVRLLDNLPQISVVRHIKDGGWEPFDRHNCGWLSLRNLERCLELIFDRNPLDLDRLNGIYARRARNPLREIDKTRSVGFKMRFNPPHPVERVFRVLRNAVSRALLRRDAIGPFKRTMIELLKRNEVTVFLAVRQDVFRWALSKYRGDGAGKRGHIQFKLASGAISRNDLEKTPVDLRRFEKIVQTCEKSHATRRLLMEDFRSAGLRVHPLRYEDFLADKKSYLLRLLDALEVDAAEADVEAALQKDVRLKKVHSNDISDFVENHEELTARFGHRFVSW